MKTLFKTISIYFFAFASTSLVAQTGSLTGKVRDDSGNPVTAATVTLEKTSINTLTDDNGKFRLENIPSGTQTIVVRLLGYKPLIQSVEVKENETVKVNLLIVSDIKTLNEVTISGKTSINGMGHLDEVHDGIVYSGKKNEVIVLDSLNANIAQNNPRQALGRIPGANFSETEGGGFPSNGFGLRGLNPAQSIEMDTRQNGYNIAGDIYGYPESYYITPLAATERVEVTRGASSLQFGPQFGGVINYIVKKAPVDKPFEFTTQQTGGSFGLFKSFNSIGGTYKKWSYYTFFQYNGITGWRPNSQVQQGTGFARIDYQATSKLKIGFEYSMLRNTIHMPGGLDDAEFNQNADQSVRARNWLTTPWNILALTAEYKVSDKTLFTFKSALNISQRNIVWRNEDGGAQAIDSISTATNSYTPREVEHEGFKSSTSELRMLTKYTIKGVSQTLSAGVRFFGGFMNREEGGVGSTGSDFNMTNYAGSYENNLNFTTLSVAPFMENIFHIGQRLSVTPGIRYEYIKSTATGYVTGSDQFGNDSIINVNASKPRYIPLAGLGTQFKTTNTTNIYGNISQAYRPIEYSFLYPLGLDVNAKIDPKLKDITGYNADLGWRGTIKNFINFDIGGFYLRKNREIAIETQTNANGNSYSYLTNVADGIHKGIETYVEFNITKMFNNQSKTGNLSFFNSFAYDNAKYVDGLYKGNWVAFAPKTIERVGITYAIKGFSTTFLVSNTSKSFSDANNTVFNEDAEVGIIPSYTVMDWSATLKIKRYNIKMGVNNLANEKYFTMRTNEYPGPGIIPSIGRSFNVGFGATF